MESKVNGNQNLRPHSFLRDFLLRFGLYFILFMSYSYASAAITSKILVYSQFYTFASTLHSSVTLSMFISLFLTLYKRKKNGFSTRLHRPFFGIVLILVIAVFANIAWVVPEANYDLLQNVSNLKELEPVSRGNRERTIGTLFQQRKKYIEQIEKFENRLNNTIEKSQGRSTERELRKIKTLDRLIQSRKRKLQKFNMEILKSFYLPLHIIPIVIISYGLALLIGSIQEKRVRRLLIFLLFPPILIKSHLIFYLSFQTNRFYNTVPAISLALMTVIGVTFVIISKKIDSATVSG